MTENNKKYFNNLHHGAKASTHEHARQLRHAETEAEQKLWAFLRNRQIKGKKFRRQHAISNYVLDFYCHESKLAIELDGNHHNEKETQKYDTGRTLLLNEYNITVLRFWNQDVISDTEKVLNKIASLL